MGFKKDKRPRDLRTKAATDLKFDVAVSTGSINVPTVTSTGTITGNALATTGAVTGVSFTSTGLLTGSAIKRVGISTSTAAATITGPGVFALSATSTTNGAQVIWTLGDPSSGMEMLIAVDTAGASSFSFKLNSTQAPFGQLPLTTSQTQAVLTAVTGSFIQLIGFSSARWLVGGNSGVTFSSSTG